MTTVVLPSGDLLIQGVHLAHQDDKREQVYDVTCSAGYVISISSSTFVNERPSILIPAYGLM
jgi:invasion protein IalB